jgi:hypothetical protein
MNASLPDPMSLLSIDDDYDRAKAIHIQLLLTPNFIHELMQKGGVEQIYKYLVPGMGPIDKRVYIFEALSAEQLQKYRCYLIDFEPYILKIIRTYYDVMTEMKLLDSSDIKLDFERILDCCKNTKDVTWKDFNPMCALLCGETYYSQRDDNINIFTVYDLWEHHMYDTSEKFINMLKKKGYLELVLNQGRDILKVANAYFIKRMSRAYRKSL